MGLFDSLFGLQSADNLTNGVNSANGLLASNQASNTGTLTGQASTATGSINSGVGSALTFIGQGTSAANDALTSGVNQSLYSLNRRPLQLGEQRWRCRGRPRIRSAPM